ncbi:NAD(P)(+) transhydrogenase (Re/Si-specific) subunit beta [Streptomyces sp. NPDC056002]|uniref:NAD(P)(+) transhydrogenase (Re/Si-specific) subunit beta n=1 Tax=unclassified Streptomyces TaxID=2593676 RepID=UPI0035DF2681
MLIRMPHESNPGGSLAAATTRAIFRPVSLGHDLIVESGADDQPGSAFTEAARGVTVVRDGESTWPPTVRVAAGPAGQPTAPIAQGAVEKETQLMSPDGGHPVLDHPPGHGNVLMAEAKMPDPFVLKLDEIHDGFPQTDAVPVTGTNRTVNPAASQAPSAPIAGTPGFDVWNAKDVIHA